QGGRVRSRDGRGVSLGRLRFASKVSLALGGDDAGGAPAGEGEEEDGEEAAACHERDGDEAELLDVTEGAGDATGARGGLLREELHLVVVRGEQQSDGGH